MNTLIENVVLKKVHQGRRQYQVVLLSYGTSKTYTFIVPGQDDSDLEWERGFSEDFLLGRVSMGVKIMTIVCEFDHGKEFSFPMKIISEAL